MPISYGGKLYGYNIVKREKIAPSRTASSAKTVEGKQRIAEAAQKVIRTHRGVLISLRDK